MIVRERGQRLVSSNYRILCKVAIAFSGKLSLITKKIIPFSISTFKTKWGIVCVMFKCYVLSKMHVTIKENVEW